MVKNQVSRNSPSTKPSFRCCQSWSLSGLGNLPTPRVGNLPLSTGDPNLSSPWAECEGRLTWKRAYLTGMILMFFCWKQSHLVMYISDYYWPLSTCILCRPIFFYIFVSGCFYPAKIHIYPLPTRGWNQPRPSPPPTVIPISDRKRVEPPGDWGRATWWPSRWVWPSRPRVRQPCILTTWHTWWGALSLHASDLSWSSSSYSLWACSSSASWWPSSPSGPDIHL